MKVELKIDWATHEAAKYACENWHYSKSVPMPPLVKIGVWENDKYIGCVLFSRGASPNLLAPYGLSQLEGCELTRVALTKHTNPVSRIIKIAVKFLKKNSPNLRLIISFADKNQGHHGGIYQAGGWIYSGKSSPKTEYVDSSGKKWHTRQVTESGVVKQFGSISKGAKKSDCRVIKIDGKHRYLMPLDNDMRKRILPLSKPYPKRAGGDTSDTPAFQAGEGGSLPTPALHSQSA